MAEQEYVVVCAGAYPIVAAALAVLDTVRHLHKDEVIGKYDAAVIDKENGKPHVVKPMDHPHIRVIPEWFGGGAAAGARRPLLAAKSRCDWPRSSCAVEPVARSPGSRKLGTG